jgi:hypothetical protein
MRRMTTEATSRSVTSVEVTSGSIEFTPNQLCVVAGLLMGPRKPEVMEYLKKHYNISITAEIHDSATVSVPTSVTATDASVIVTELQALFG